MRYNVPLAPDETPESVAEKVEDLDNSAFSRSAKAAGKTGLKATASYGIGYAAGRAPKVIEQLLNFIN